jgi:MtN3 and saliva related transmembrane protein
MDLIILGLLAGGVVSIGFVPQLARGYRTKKMDDVSYYMPLVLTFGMALWIIYGAFRNDLAIIATNVVGVGCNIALIGMKKFYEAK